VLRHHRHFLGAHGYGQEEKSENSRASQGDKTLAAAFSPVHELHRSIFSDYAG
jgi:hypothetical protein